MSLLPSNASLPPYRPCVGITLVNRDGLVFMGRRRNKKLVEHVAPGFEWQMPQGGVDPDEDPYLAAIRELREETTVSSVSLIAEAPDWFAYDLRCALRARIRRLTSSVPTAAGTRPNLTPGAGNDWSVRRAS